MNRRSVHPARSRARAAVLCCTLALTVPLGGAAQPGIAPDAYSVAEAIQDTDGDGLPERLNEAVTVEGTITLSPVPLGAFGSFALLQGDAGVVLYSLDPAALGGLERGHRVRIGGRLRDCQGQAQVYVGEFDVLGAGELPEPIEIRAGELQDRGTGRLVRAEGTLRVERGGSVFQLRLEDGTGSVPIFVSPQLLTDVELLNRLLRSEGRRVEVRGALLQGRLDGGDTREHYILPLSAEDVVLPPIVPYREIASGTLLLLLALAVAYMARKRKAAQLEAQVQQALATRLRASETALRETEQRLRHMLETSTCILYRTVHEEGETRTVWMSENLSWLLGYTTEEAMPINWFRDCLH